MKHIARDSMQILKFLPKKLDNENKKAKNVRRNIEIKIVYAVHAAVPDTSLFLTLSLTHSLPRLLSLRIKIAPIHILLCVHKIYLGEMENMNREQ